MHNSRNTIVIVLLMSLALLTSGCMRSLNPSRELPPILTQDELIRPYLKLGRIQVTREVYSYDLRLTPDIREWGFQAIREEAAKMGADAVILPEVTGHSSANIIVPSTEYRATGVAIKFK
jgi:uncharacterized protein YbjQ (UPF0145 family)